MSPIRRRAGRGRAAEPAPLDDALERAAADLGIPAGDALSALERAWEDIVGASAAPHARPVAVVDGRLSVEVDSAPIATELRYQEARIVEATNAALGLLGAPGAVRRLRLRVR